VELTAGVIPHCRHACAVVLPHSPPTPLAFPPTPELLLSGFAEVWVNSAGLTGSTGDGGAAVSARLSSPEGVLVYDGMLLVCDRGNSVIRAVDLQTRVMTRWAGTGGGSALGDGSDKLAIDLPTPYGLALMPDDSVAVSLYGSCRVWRITSAGVMRAFAGTGASCTTAGNGGAATSATLNRPIGVAVANTSSTGVMVYWAENVGRRVSAGISGGEGRMGRVGHHELSDCRLTADFPPPSSLPRRCARRGGTRPPAQQVLHRRPAARRAPEPPRALAQARPRELGRRR